MSNETKRDVFEKALREWDDLVHSCGLQGEETHGGCEFDPVLIKYKKDYDDALPDDLPVIPKAVGAFIKQQKAVEDNLATLFYDACGFDKERGNGWSMFQDTDNFLWAYDNQNTFARAWVLGVWCVEETGEIVKLGAKK